MEPLLKFDKVNELRVEALSPEGTKGQSKELSKKAVPSSRQLFLLKAVLPALLSVLTPFLLNPPNSEDICPQPLRFAHEIPFMHMQQRKAQCALKRYWNIDGFQVERRKHEGVMMTLLRTGTIVDSLRHHL